MVGTPRLRDGSWRRRRLVPRPSAPCPGIWGALSGSVWPANSIFSRPSQEGVMGFVGGLLKGSGTVKGVVTFRTRPPSFEWKVLVGFRQAAPGSPLERSQSHPLRAARLRRSGRSLDRSRGGTPLRPRGSPRPRPLPPGSRLRGVLQQVEQHQLELSLIEIPVLRGRRRDELERMQGGQTSRADRCPRARTGVRARDRTPVRRGAVVTACAWGGGG